MCHFLIVNTTQKSVDAAIEQQIVARLTDMINFKKMPVLPRWIQRQVDKGEDQRALSLVNFLNTASDSPWKRRVLMANKSEDETWVTQKSFVTSLKKHVLVPSNPIGGPAWSVEKQQKVLLNYWRAIKRLLVDKEDEISVVFRTNGLELFHGASPAVFLHLANRQDFKEETIVSLLTHAFDNLPTDFIGMAQPGFWYRGGTASGSAELEFTSMPTRWPQLSTFLKTREMRYFENHRPNSPSRSSRTLRVPGSARDRSRSGVLCTGECWRGYPLYRAGCMHQESATSALRCRSPS
jgi:hypothetical protein